MYKMKSVAIALFIFSTCSLQLGFSSAESSNPVINDVTAVIPVTEVNPPSNGSNSGETSTDVSPVTTAKPPIPPTNGTTTIKPNITTTVTTTIKPNTTTNIPSTPAPKPTSSSKPTTTQPTDKTTTLSPSPAPVPNSTTTVKPTAAPPTTPTPSHRRFDGPSFIGGIVLALGLVAIGFVAFKFYKARTELNYHTL